MSYIEFSALETYAPGEKIKINHYNSFSRTVKQLMFTGYGSYGYGQSTDDYQDTDYVAAGKHIYADQWIELADLMQVMFEHQNGTDSDYAQVTSDLFVAGEQIVCLDGVVDDLNEDGVDLQDELLSIQENHLEIADDNYGTVTLSSTSYSSAWEYAMYQVVDIEWDTADEARYFFNCGGKIVARVYSTEIGTTDRCVSWYEMLEDTYFTIAAESTSTDDTVTEGTIVTPNDCSYYNASTDESRAGYSISMVPLDGTISGHNGSVDDDTYGIYAAMYNATGVVDELDGIRMSHSVRNYNTDGTNGDNGRTMRFTTGFYNVGGVEVNNYFYIVFSAIVPTDFTVSTPTATVVTTLASNVL